MINPSAMFNMVNGASKCRWHFASSVTSTLTPYCDRGINPEMGVISLFIELS